jgi:hypothetical protein
MSPIFFFLTDSLLILHYALQYTSKFIIEQQVTSEFIHLVYLPYLDLGFAKSLFKIVERFFEPRL